jgi:hypothetical protein
MRTILSEPELNELRNAHNYLIVEYSARDKILCVL